MPRAEPGLEKYVSMGLAADYRRACCDALEQAGPDAPTLCEGWKTRDLAVHLILRERRPDAVITSLLSMFRPYAKRVEDGYRAKPYDALVTMVRTGPPLSPTKLPPVDDLMNIVEFYVHTQDVVRAAPTWVPTDEGLSEHEEDVLWGRLKTMGRLLCLKSPTGIEAVRSGGAGDESAMLHPSTKLGVVRVTGRPSELLLFAFGRSGVAQVALDGSAAAVSALRKAPLGF